MPATSHAQALACITFMEWIPYQRLTITTDLTRDEVIDRMRKWVGPKKRENFVRVDNNIFSGRLVKDKFEFSLHKDYRNSWTPEITGTIKESNGKVELLVTLKSNWFVIIFTGLFMIIGLTMFVLEIINYKDTGDIHWLTILAFVIFPYGLTWFGFNLDADKSIDGLIKITKGEIK
jgi:hypothetical protein